jgi:hypothetical protein
MLVINTQVGLRPGDSRQNLLLQQVHAIHASATSVHCIQLLHLIANAHGSNRHYAEHSGYWLKTKFLEQVEKSGETTFYDTVTGKPLFVAPRGRTFQEFQDESR